MDHYLYDYLSPYKYLQYAHKLTSPPEVRPVHIHDTYEIFYLISGNMTFYIEGYTYRTSRNSLLIFNSRELHKYKLNSLEPYERIVIQFIPSCINDFKGYGVDLLHCFEQRDSGTLNMLTPEVIQKYRIDQYFIQMERHLTEKRQNIHLMIKTLFIQLLAALNDTFPQGNDNRIHIMEADNKLSNIIDYINNRLYTHITLEMLENEFYINKYHLCHLFKKQTGFSIFEYITSKRILEAQKLLSQGMSVIEVSDRVGFGDYSCFYKAFKRTTGRRPSEFTKNSL